MEGEVVTIIIPSNSQHLQGHKFFLVATTPPANDVNLTHEKAELTSQGRPLFILERRDSNAIADNVYEALLNLFRNLLLTRIPSARIDGNFCSHDFTERFEIRCQLFFLQLWT